MSGYTLNILDYDSSIFGKKIFDLKIFELKEDRVNEAIKEIKRRSAHLTYFLHENDPKKNSLIKKYLNHRPICSKLVYLKYTNPKCYKNIDLSNNLIFINNSKTNFNLTKLAYTAGKYSRFRIDPKIPMKIFRKIYFDWLKKSLTNEDRKTLVYKIDNKIAGFLTLKLTNYRINIELLSTNPFYRNLGIASKLLKSAEIYALNLGIPEITVSTQGENIPARNLYENFGFFYIAIHIISI